MRPKSIVLLFLALGCGLVASIGISQVMDKNRQQARPSVETDAIYVAKHDINLGDPIKPEMVNLEEWPKDKIPSGAIRELSALEGRRPRAKIFVGEPILDGKLLGPGEHDNATDTITKGYRVLPISVKADTGGAGLLKPGDRVDVQCFIPRNQSMGILETTTKTILHNIRVFAVDQTTRLMSEGEESAIMAKTVSLLVTPKQANVLQLANKVGEISLVARNPDDAAADDTAQVSFEDLLGSVEKNNREKEQDRNQEETASEGHGGFLGSLLADIKSKAMKGSSGMVQQRPPFRMELISGDAVEVKWFEPIHGRPIDQKEIGQSGTGFGAPTSEPWMPQASGTNHGPPASSSSGSDNDFPIDLEEGN
ncbi:MAG: Flp pilus assembly protein CpaB [Pirellulales bacterium]|nr:Flp pilus assembly protein CpaB [Pirellulales bacterium]